MEVANSGLVCWSIGMMLDPLQEVSILDLPGLMWHPDFAMADISIDASKGDFAIKYIRCCSISGMMKASLH